MTVDTARECVVVRSVRSVFNIGLILLYKRSQNPSNDHLHHDPAVVASSISTSGSQTLSLRHTTAD